MTHEEQQMGVRCALFAMQWLIAAVSAGYTEDEVRKIADAIADKVPPAAWEDLSDVLETIEPNDLKDFRREQDA